MKVRAQRTHYSGASNRHIESFNNTQNITQNNYNHSNNKTQSVFERSFNKSKSLYYRTMADTSNLIDPTTNNPNNTNLNLTLNKCTNPFQGTHIQFQSQRFDKMNVKPYKYQKMNIPHGRKTITFAPLLNSKINNIKQQFQSKNINMHKLNELKRAFVKNNRERRNLEGYFAKYAEDGCIHVGGLKKIVKQYGFDINDEQANLIVKLTNKSTELTNITNNNNSNSKEQNYLNKQGFVQLMTRQDVFYNTLQLNQKNPKQQTFQNSFSQKVHEILRNKFPKLKQAFKIYRQRNQQIGLKQYEYVMKKLDLTDLVITKQQREKIYKDYSNQKGEFNVQGLICAIAEQEYKNRNLYKTDFIDDLQVNKQVEFNNSRKIREFQLRNLSNLEYQNQYNKARAVISQLRKLKKKRKQNNQDQDIFKNISENKASQNSNTYTSKQQFIKTTQKILKNQGINFQKQDYDALGAYLNYDVHGNITVNKINHILFTQKQKQAQERFERKLRKQVPKNTNNLQSQHINSLECDQKVAISSINKLKQNKMNPQTRELFKFLDKDQDGFVSAREFKEKVNSLNIMENWEIENLAGYLKVNQEGSINFRDFSKRINQDLKALEKDLPFVRTQNSKSCYQWADTTTNKKNIIKNANQTNYQRPTKFSAWPQNITHQDLSLVQPPQNAGMYTTEAQRFGQRKQDYGMRQKMNVMAVAEARRQKIVEWNRIMNEKAQVTRQKEEQRAAARNYALRLTKQKYQFNCHQ